ncbi:MAG TPA: peptide ABC transporter substrate-binding protein [Bacilli bacterium]|nr:peptide ABC transporter substrate-binding protein [Bacilli bacterium]
MKAKKWLGIGLAVTMLSSVALVGCGDNESEGNNTADGEKKAEPQVLNLALGDEIPAMDSSIATDSIAFTMLAQTNEGLVTLDQQGKPAPGVAESWEQSEDGLTYTFHLRDNAKWSDGSNVTAQDFEYAWKRTLNPDTGAQYAFMMTWIKGGAAYNNGEADADAVQVKATDDRTLVVTLENPVPFFVQQMAFPLFFPQKKDFVEKYGDKYAAEAENMLSNGPFKMTEWVHEQSVTLEKNSDYWNADNVHLEKVNYQVVKDSAARENLYASGQIDRTSLVRDQVDQYKDSPEFYVTSELVNGYLQYNEKVKVLTNKHVRQALTYAIDGDAYADIIYHNGSIGATGFVPKGTSNGDGGDFREDNGDLINRAENAAKAKDILAQGLEELGMDKFPNLKILMDDGDIGKKAGEFIKEQWRTKLGIDVEIENVPFKLRLQRTTERDYDIVLSLWGADYNDPMTFLDMWVTGGDFNENGYSNKEYDDLVLGAKKEVDAKKRMDALYEAEKILMEDMPVGPIFFRGAAGVSKPYVKNWVTRSYGPSYELKWVTIEGKE